MKAIAKWTGVILAGLTLLGLVAWTGTFLYWRFRIQSAMHVLAHGPTDPEETRAIEVLANGGCRSLPYLIRGLETAPEQDIFWESVHVILALQVDRSEGRVLDAQASEILNGPLLAWHQENESGRKNLASRIRAWWEANHSTYHQWWRVWTSSCRR